MSLGTAREAVEAVFGVITRLRLDRAILADDLDLTGRAKLAAWVVQTMVGAVVGCGTPAFGDQPPAPRTFNRYC
jgi:hypothetical protein